MKKKIIVKNSQDAEWNGEYFEGNVKWKDKSSISYVKDSNHHIYLHNGNWRLGECGVRLYEVLGNKIENEIDLNLQRRKLLCREITLRNEIDLNLQGGKIPEMINICFCSDENLVEFIPTVINSILRKNSNYKINIHYIHNIDDEKKINNLKKYINKYNNLTLFSYYKTWDRNYKGIKHVSVATMLRIFIPDLIKCTKIIYLDIDIVVNLDLHELYDINCGETGIALKNSIHPTITKYFDDNSGKKSGNCGIIVMNLETLRKNNFTQKCLEIHSKNENRHDQHIINMYANGKYTVLEPRFNIFLNQDDYLVEKETEFILHYAGSKKPYYHNTGKYQYLWDIFKCINIFSKNLGINLKLGNEQHIYSNILIIGWLNDKPDQMSIFEEYFPNVLDMKDLKSKKHNLHDLIYLYLNICLTKNIKYIIFTDNTSFDLIRPINYLKQNNLISSKIFVSSLKSYQPDHYNYVDLIFEYNIEWFKKYKNNLKEHFNKLRLMPYTTKIIIKDVDQNIKNMTKEKYILAVGKNFRDWTFISEACNYLKIRLIILDTNIDKWKEKIPASKYITFYKTDKFTCNYFIKNCLFTVIPIDKNYIGKVQVGITVARKSFMLNKIVIGTKECGLDNVYIKDKVNGLLIENTTKEYINAIRYLLKDNKFKELEKNISKIESDNDVINGYLKYVSLNDKVNTKPPPI